MKLVSRIKKIQEDLSTLKEQCRELLSAKQVHFFTFFFFLNENSLIFEANIKISGFFFFFFVGSIKTGFD